MSHRSHWMPQCVALRRVAAGAPIACGAVEAVLLSMLLAGASSSRGALPRPVSPTLAERVAEWLQVLGEPTRVRLIEYLERVGEQSVREIARALGLSEFNASQQLGVLRRAGLARRRQAGRLACYALIDPTVVEIYEQVAERLARRVRDLRRGFTGDDETTN